MSRCDVAIGRHVFDGGGQTRCSTVNLSEYAILYNMFVCSRVECDHIHSAMHCTVLVFNHMSLFWKSNSNRSEDRSIHRIVQVRVQFSVDQFDSIFLDEISFSALLSQSTVMSCVMGYMFVPIGLKYSLAI